MGLFVLLIIVVLLVTCYAPENTEPNYVIKALCPEIMEITIPNSQEKEDIFSQAVADIGINYTIEDITAINDKNATTNRLLVRVSPR